jgi:hypothetical protein
MNTITRGNAAEAALLDALVSVDFGVFIPFGGGHPFDLIAVLPDDRLVRVQVKSGRLHKQSIEFNSASTDHGHGRQHYRDRVDMFGVHAHELGQIFMVPPSACATSRGYLRLEPPANNYRRGVRMAEDYTFEIWAGRARSAASSNIESSTLALPVSRL